MLNCFLVFRGVDAVGYELVGVRLLHVAFNGELVNGLDERTLICTSLEVSVVTSPVPLLMWFRLFICQRAICE